MRDQQKRWRVDDHEDMGEAGVSHPHNQEERVFLQAGNVE